LRLAEHRYRIAADDFDDPDAEPTLVPTERLRKRANSLAWKSVPTSVPTRVFGASLKVHFTPVFPG